MIPHDCALELILLCPSSIVQCLCLIGVWLPCLFPHRLTKSHTGNRQYKHRAQEIVSCLESGLQNLSANRHRHWLCLVWGASHESDRFMNIVSDTLSSLYWLRRQAMSVARSFLFYILVLCWTWRQLILTCNLSKNIINGEAGRRLLCAQRDMMI